MYSVLKQQQCVNSTANPLFSIYFACDLSWHIPCQTLCWQSTCLTWTIIEWSEAFHCLNWHKSYRLCRVNGCLDGLTLKKTLTDPKLIPAENRSNLIISSQPHWTTKASLIQSTRPHNSLRLICTLRLSSNTFTLFTLILFWLNILCNQMLSKASSSRRYVLLSRRMRCVIMQQLWQSEGWASELWGAPVCLFISRCCQQEAERSFTSIRQICSALSTRQPGKPDGKEW